MPGEINPLSAGQSYADKSLAIVKTNPGLKNDPLAVHTLASTPGVDGHTIAQAAKFGDIYSGVKTAMADHANSNPHASNFWSGLTHFGEGVFSGAVDLVKGGWNTAARTATTATELGTFGLIGDKGIGNFAGNLKDASQTVTNFAKNVEPLQAWKTAAHIGAYYESMVNRKGWAYALGNLTPTLVSTMFGGEVLAGAGVGNAAVDAERLASIASKVQAGTATTEDIAQYASISSRVSRKSSAATAEADAKIADANKVATESKAFNTSKNVFQGGAKWTLGMGAKAIKTAVDVSQNLKLNAFYAGSGIQAQSSDDHRAMWDATMSGHAVDVYGRPLNTTAGQYLTEALGIHAGSAPYSLVSGALDTTALMASDPYTAISGIRKGMNTAEGIGGVLGKWWHGIGVESGADVVRTANATSGVRKAYQYMADHSAPEISKAFKGMYTPEILSRLGNAHTVQAVIDIHAEVADGAYLTRNLAPTLKIWRTISSAIRDAIAAPHGAGEDYSAVVSDAEAILKKMGIKTSIESVIEASSKDIGQVGRVWGRRFLDRQTTESVWYIEEAMKKGDIPNIKNYTFRMGDKNAIKALQSMYKLSGVFPAFTVDIMGKVLQETKSAEDFSYALHNLTVSMLDGALSSMTKSANYESVYAQIRPIIEEDVRKLISSGGGGNKGIYSNGSLGEAYSELANPEDKTLSGFFGFGNTHISQGSFIDPRNIKGMVKKYAAMIDGLDSTIVGEAERLRYLDRASLTAAASYKNATIKGLMDAAESTVTKRIQSYVGQTGNEFLSYGYSSAHDMIKNVIDKISKDATFNEFEKFVEASKQVSEATQTLQRQVQAMKDEATNFFTNREADVAKVLSSKGEDNAAKLSEILSARPPDANKLYEAQGRLQALSDMERRLFSRIQEPSRKLSDYRSWAAELGFHTAEEKQLSTEVRDAIVSGLEAQRVKAGTYLDRRNLFVDFANRLLSHTFIPLALSTGGYVMRIAGAEWIPNMMRMGSLNMIESRLMASIAKHEARGVPLQESAKLIDGVKVTEAGLIKRHVLETANLLMDRSRVANKIAAGGKITRDIMAGSLTGVERGILQAMSPERFYRMLDDFSGALTITGGVIPDVGHSSSQLYNSNSVTGGMGENTYGVSADGKDAVVSTGFNSEKHVRANGEHSATAMQRNLQRIHSDSKMLDIAKDINSIFKGRNFKIGSQKEFDALHTQLMELDHARKLQLTANEREVFQASTWPLKDPALTTGDPMKDWAKSSTYHVLSTFVGIDKKGEYILHPGLLEQAVSGEIKGPASIAADMVKMGGSAPKHLIDRQFMKYPWQTEGARSINALMSVPERLNSAVVDKTFGKLISWVSREPIFLWEYHVAMEDLRPRIAQNFINVDQAEVEAMNIAFRKMTKFVHNPADRYGFEQNTRMYAPFWFAKNQAFRRSFRLIEENPDAFNTYLKSCLHTTNYLHNNATDSSNPTITVPHSEWPTGLFSSFLTKFSSNNSLFSDLGFGLVGNLSSLQTVIPTGVATGSAMAEDMIRPNPGPFVSILLKLVGDTGLFDHKYYNKFLEATLGPIGSQTGVMSDLLPSAFYRGLFAASADYAAHLAGWNLSFGPVVQAEVKAMHSALDNMRTNYVNQFYDINKNVKWASTDQKYVDANIYADYEMSNYFNSYKNQQKFMDDAHMAALGLYMSKLVIGFSSPVSVSLNEKFSKSPEFAKILKQKSPDGTQISFATAIAEFSVKHPGNLVDLFSTSQSPYGPFGETKNFMTWHENAPELLKTNGIPNLAAYLIDRSGKFYAPAYTAQVGMGLRKADTPQEYMDTVLKSLGNDYYYNYLVPQYYTEYGSYAGPNNPNNTISYEGQKMLTSAAKEFAYNFNPTGGKFGSPLGIDARPKEIAAVNQLNALMNDQAMQQKIIKANLLTPTEMEYLGQAVNIYNQHITAIKAASSGTGRYSIEQDLYQIMTKAAADPSSGRLSYLFSQVLAKAPTK